VARATAALAVTTPDPAATTDTYALCKLLAQRGKRLPWLVVNRAASTAQAHKVAVHLAAVCERFLGKAPPLLGVVRSDPAFERSVVEQRPVCLSAPELADELRRLSCGVMEAVTRQVGARQSHAWARSTQTA
jgi:flagellar biosynthesis protein FlhG